MQKRGLSTVITSLILILLVLVTVGIVWVIVRNIIQEGSEDISIGHFGIDLEIKNVVVDPLNNEINVTITRNPGGGKIDELNIILSDDINTHTFKETFETDPFDELETRTFGYIYTGYDGWIKKVLVAPSVGLGVDASVGDPVDEFDVEDTEVAESIPGLVSWWRFEELGGGDTAYDEMGLNDGSCSDPECPTLTSGQYRQAYEFDGDDDYINCGGDDSLKLTSSRTYAAWVNAEDFPRQPGGQGTNDRIIKNGNSMNFGFDWGDYVLFYLNGLDLDPETTNNYINTNFAFTSETGKWYHIVGTWDNDETIARIYINGVEDISSTGTGTLDTPTENFQINDPTDNQEFKGIIDEPMIFNRALSSAEVEDLYNLDLS